MMIVVTILVLGYGAWFLFLYLAARVVGAGFRRGKGGKS